MNSSHEKEKKLNQALEKLNSINPQKLNFKETITNLDQQKNQLEIEKNTLEMKYDDLQEEYKKLKLKIDELDNKKETEVRTFPVPFALEVIN